MKGKVVLIFLAAALMLGASLAAAQAPTKGYTPAQTKVLNKIQEPADENNKAIFSTVLKGIKDNPVVWCIPALEASGQCTVSPGIKALRDKWIQLLVPFYIIAFLFTALFYLLKAGTPRGRARSRGMFVKLLFGMVLVIASPIIYQVLLETSAILVKFFFGQWGTPAYAASINLGLFNIGFTYNPFDRFDENGSAEYMFSVLNFTGMGMACIFSLFEAIVLLVGGLIMWLRKMMVFFYAVFFPLLVFLYTFEVTKPEGQKYINGALKWIFVPPVQALILVFVVAISKDIRFDPTHITFSVGTIMDYAVYQMISNSMAGIVLLAGIAGFCFAPMIVTQLMGWLGNAVVAVGLGSGRQWMVAVGGIMAGGGSGAIIQADAEYARGNSLQRYMNAVSSTGSLGSHGGAPGSGTAGASGGAEGASGQGGGGGGGHKSSGSDILGPSGSQQPGEQPGSYQATQSSKQTSAGGSVYGGFGSGHQSHDTEEPQEGGAKDSGPEGPTPAPQQQYAKAPGAGGGGFSPDDLRQSLGGGTSGEGKDEEKAAAHSISDDIQSILGPRTIVGEQTTSRNVESESRRAAAAKQSGSTGRDISLGEGIMKSPTPMEKSHMQPSAGAGSASDESRIGSDFEEDEKKRLEEMAEQRKRDQAAMADEQKAKAFGARMTQKAKDSANQTAALERQGSDAQVEQDKTAAEDGVDQQKAADENQANADKNVSEKKRKGR